MECPQFQRLNHSAGNRWPSLVSFRAFFNFSLQGHDVGGIASNEVGFCFPINEMYYMISFVYR